MYATLEAMVNKFGEREIIALTDRGPPFTNTINNDVLNDAIETVNGEIDSYIGSRYAVPLNPVPKVLTQQACDMVRYYLTGAAATATDDITSRYNNAIKFLTRVNKGELTLGGMPNEAGVAQTTSNTAQMSSGGRVFGRDGW